MTMEMRYHLLGRSGLRVSELGLGTMTFGTDWGWGADLEESRRIFGLYAEAGGNFVDTASNYTDGSSEEFVGRLVEGRRERFVIATKYTLSLDADDPNAGGNHRKSLVRALEQSLRRLGTDYVDLLYLHMRDDTTPIEEAVRALDDQVRLGKVLYVGVSDSPAWLVAQANTLAELRGWSPFVALQIPYSASGRSPERELFPMAAALGLTVVAWGVLEAGILTGKPAAERRWPEDGVSERDHRVLDAITGVARDRGRTPAQVAIAWVRQRPAPPTVVPLIAARREDQIAQNLEAVSVVLDDDELAAIDEAGRPELGFPRDFLESAGVRELIYGSTYERILARR
jgi:aryl-alcohol dehydrogenase-like predicted oxidoreductase